MKKSLQYIKQSNCFRRSGLRSFHTQSVFQQPMVNLPELGDSITSGVVQEICAEEGTWCPTDAVIYRVETDKILADVRMPESGVLTNLVQPLDEEIEVGVELFEYDVAETAPEGAPVYGGEEAAEEEEAPAQESSSPAQSTPSAPSTPAPSAPTQSAPVRTAMSGEGERRVPMSKMRKTIAKRLKESQNTYALLTTFNEIDMSQAIEFRKQYQAEFQEKYGIKMGFMGIFLKAAATALQTWPDVNAVIDGDDVVYRDYVDIGVAVSTPTGLVVPVVRNVESLSIPEIELEIQRLAQKGRDGTMSLADMAGGSFTVSNGGVFGSMMGTPIVNPPQSAILGMHATKKRPVVVTENGEDKIVIRPVMFSALTYDHRLIDGSTGVRFLKQLGSHVEDPRSLLL